MSGVVAILTDALEDCEWLLSSSVKVMDVSPEQLRRVIAAVTELQAAAHASLAARDLADQLAADDRLRAALAACEPTDTDHNREAVDGLCVEESDNGV